MLGLFGKRPTIHKVEAESVAQLLADMAKDMSNTDFVNSADRLVREACFRVGITEELKDKEYREICQLAIRLKSGDRSRATVDSTLKSF